jgi:hypothetical protein
MSDNDLCELARRRPQRLEIRLTAAITATQERELGALVRYCVLRTERDVGIRGRWSVTLEAIQPDQLTSTVVVDDDGDVIDAIATGRDAALATWDAMCSVERALRDRHLS